MLNIHSHASSAYSLAPVLSGNPRSDKPTCKQDFLWKPTPPPPLPLPSPPTAAAFHLTQGFYTNREALGSWPLLILDQDSGQVPPSAHTPLAVGKPAEAPSLISGALRSACMLANHTDMNTKQEVHLGDGRWGWLYGPDSSGRW